ncbi:MAG: T9SS C-terminal target domain-containing protein [Saprospirales bacterium]|nr:MAG: T9SS C-terminal target domain-containing protein [Saprospirales bacterium]
MKLISPFFILFFSYPLFSQLEINLDIVFEATFDQNYIPLEEFTNLTEGLGAWDYFFDEEIVLTYPIIMPGFEDRPINLLEIGAFSGIYLGYSNWPDDPYELDLEIFPIDEFILVSPLYDPMNSDQGDILLYESEELLIVEYRNVGIYQEMELGDGNLFSRLNFQIEINKVELCVRFKYGPSNLSQGMQDFFFQGLFTGLLFGWFYEESVGGSWIEDYEHLYGLVSGFPNDPEIVTVLESRDNPFEGIIPIINFYPEEGTIYQFCFDEPSSTEAVHNNKNNWQIYPSPVSDYLHITFPESFEAQGKNYQIQLMDVYGKLVLEQSIAEHQYISVQTLPSGIYFAQLKAQNSFDIQRVVISR